MTLKSIYPGGTVVFVEDDQPRGVYCICSGRVKLSGYSSDGRAVIVDIATAGNVLGVKELLSGNPYNLTAETLVPTQLCFIRKDDFLGFLNQNGDVCLRLVEELCTKLCEAHRKVSDAALKRSYERLVELLLRLYKSHGEPTSDGVRLNINLSQEELAEEIGVSRRTLTRALTNLKRLGIIECRRRSIIVRDRVALENSLTSKNLLQ
ncbi:MAG: Crp/Fnr family transcriptional regulator [Candidatus Dadabacteria bacterium]|nr:Crp/Fnr family transcriptional regulator [Candidatus Dadabacteria bacterium]